MKKGISDKGIKRIAQEMDLEEDLETEENEIEDDTEYHNYEDIATELFNNLLNDFRDSRNRVIKKLRDELNDMNLSLEDHNLIVDTMASIGGNTWGHIGISPQSFKRFKEYE